MTETDNFNANQKRVLAALLTEPTIAAAATRARVGEKTVYRYLRDPVFKTELRTRQDAVIAGVVAGLSGLAGSAVEVLGTIMADTSIPPATRARCAIAALDQLVKLVMVRDLQDRVEALENERN